MNNILSNESNHIITISINRPKALNALNTETLLELDKILDEVKNREDIYALIITGEGEKAFVAGADIVEMKDMDLNAARKFSNLGNSVFRKLENLEIPTIAAVNGFALGGGMELALSTDIRIARENAKFSQPEVTLGITPGFGGTQRLGRLVGSSKALELILSSKMIGAKEALEIGLVNMVFPEDNYMEEVMKFVASITKNAPIAVRKSKVAIKRGLEMDIDTAISYEAEMFSTCFVTEDQKDAMNAFVEKRKLSCFKNR